MISHLGLAAFSSAGKNSKPSTWGPPGACLQLLDSPPTEGWVKVGLLYLAIWEKREGAAEVRESVVEGGWPSGQTLVWRNDLRGNEQARWSRLLRSQGSFKELLPCECSTMFYFTEFYFALPLLYLHHSLCSLQPMSLQ